jgi:hypothetical protein
MKSLAIAPTAWQAPGELHATLTSCSIQNLIPDLVTTPAPHWPAAQHMSLNF